MCLLISCELGGDRVPAWLPQSESERPPSALTSVNPVGLSFSGGMPSVGNEWLRRMSTVADRPARYVAERMAEQLGAELIAHEYSSELIDVSRSLHHRQLFSELTRNWSVETREQLVERVYQPYRRRVESAVERILSEHGFAIHLSVRSFKLKSRGKIRRADVGLLYDPSRGDEVDLCLDWIDEMWERVPMLKVRRNYPRRGTRDGVTRGLRRQFAGRDYLGVELWLNRAWVERPVGLRDEAIEGIRGSLQAILREDQEVEKIDGQIQAA